MQGKILAILTVFLVSGCSLEEKEKQLQQKEAALIEKEQSLNLKERELQILEETLKARQNGLDTTPSDTTAIQNPELVGTWAAKMVCTETTCPGSAVGDTKTEQWQLSYQNNRVIVKAISGEKVVRLYTGQYAGNVIELTEEGSTSSGAQGTSMIVRLRMTDKKSLEGTREIIREGDCRIIYSVQLTK